MLDPDPHKMNAEPSTSSEGFKVVQYIPVSETDIRLTAVPDKGDERVS
jgi:hypothetical protein